MWIMTQKLKSHPRKYRTLRNHQCSIWEPKGTWCSSTKEKFENLPEDLIEACDDAGFTRHVSLLGNFLCYNSRHSVGRIWLYKLMSRVFTCSGTEEQEPNATSYIEKTKQMQNKNKCKRQGQQFQRRFWNTGGFVGSVLSSRRNRELKLNFFGTLIEKNNDICLQ